MLYYSGARRGAILRHGGALVTDEIGTQTRAPDNEFRKMQDWLNHIRDTSLLVY